MFSEGGREGAVEKRQDSFCIQKHNKKFGFFNTEIDNQRQFDVNIKIGKLDLIRIPRKENTKK